MKYLNSATGAGEQIVQLARGALRMLVGQWPFTNCHGLPLNVPIKRLWSLLQQLQHPLLPRTIHDLLSLICVLVYAFLYLGTQTWKFIEHIEFQSQKGTQG